MLFFLALAFVWSWGIGFGAIQAQARSIGLSSALWIASGFGPSLAGLLVVALFGPAWGLRDWFARCLNWRVGWRWFVGAGLAPPVIMLCALGIHAALGGSLETSPAVGHVPLAILNFGLVLLLGGPLGEEFGWRGYAMPALARRVRWPAAGLVVGAVWGLWHLPLFFLAGTPQSKMPILVFMLNIMAGSVLFGWLSKRTQGSVLPALVLHTSLNAWSGILCIIPTPATARPYELVTGLLVVIAGYLVLEERPQAKGGRRAASPGPPGGAVQALKADGRWIRARSEDNGENSIVDAARLST